MELLPSTLPYTFWPFSHPLCICRKQRPLTTTIYLLFFLFIWSICICLNGIFFPFLYLTIPCLMYTYFSVDDSCVNSLAGKSEWKTIDLRTPSPPKTETDNIWLSFIHIATSSLLLIHFKLIACFGIGEVGDLMSTRQQKYKRNNTSYDSITTQFPFINEVEEKMWLIVFHFIDFLFSSFFFFFQFSCFIFKCYIFRLIQGGERGKRDRKRTDIQVIPVACSYDLFLCYDVFIMMRGEQQQLFDLKKPIRDRML